MCNTTKLIYSPVAIQENSGMLRQGAINIYASMPCPMKVPFKQLMTAFTAEYNATHQTPVYCPDVMDCSSEELGFLVRNTTDPDRLPDIIIAHNYEFFFEYPFEERFLKNGLFRGVTNPNDWDAMPAALRENFSRSNLGVLCFGSRSVIQDLTVAGFPDTISSWRELLTPAYEGQITVHGHLDKATFGFMYFINKHFGAEGIVRYAKNVADIKHFSQIINRLCSSDEFRTAINILPDVAAAKIPSSKKVKILELEEGKMLSPMIIVVKSSKMEQCREALDFFWSKPFRSLMSKGCILPDELEKDKPYFMPDFDVLAANYCSMEKEFNNLYLNNLNMDVIARRATEGGVCKG